MNKNQKFKALRSFHEYVGWLVYYGEPDAEKKIKRRMKELFQDKKAVL